MLLHGLDYSLKQTSDPELTFTLKFCSDWKWFLSETFKYLESGTPWSLGVFWNSLKTCCTWTVLTEKLERLKVTTVTESSHHHLTQCTFRKQKTNRYQLSLCNLCAYACANMTSVKSLFSTIHQTYKIMYVAMLTFNQCKVHNNWMVQYHCCNHKLILESLTQSNFSELNVANIFYPNTCMVILYQYRNTKYWYFIKEIKIWWERCEQKAHATLPP